MKMKGCMQWSLNWIAQVVVGTLALGIGVQSAHTSLRGMGWGRRLLRTLWDEIAGIQGGHGIQQIR